jgi:hypothetical protein
MSDSARSFRSRSCIGDAELARETAEVACVSASPSPTRSTATVPGTAIPFPRHSPDSLFPSVDVNPGRLSTSPASARLPRAIPTPPSPDDALRSRSAARSPGWPHGTCGEGLGPGAACLPTPPAVPGEKCLASLLKSPAPAPHVRPTVDAGPWVSTGAFPGPSMWDPCGVFCASTSDGKTCDVSLLLDTLFAAR